MTNAVTMYGASNESVVVYQSEDGTLKLNVQLKEESVWLTQEQIATLFGTQRPAITKHLNNIFNSGELDRTSTCSILEHMGNDGKQRYSTKYYNLDVILATSRQGNSYHLHQPSLTPTITRPPKTQCAISSDRGHYLRPLSRPLPMH